MRGATLDWTLVGGAGGAGQESHNIGPQSGDISSVCEANFVDNPSFFLVGFLFSVDFD